MSEPLPALEHESSSFYNDQIKAEGEELQFKKLSAHKLDYLLEQFDKGVHVSKINSMLSTLSKKYCKDQPSCEYTTISIDSGSDMYQAVMRSLFNVIVKGDNDK
jgi:hypothetical protein